MWHPGPVLALPTGPGGLAVGVVTAVLRAVVTGFLRDLAGPVARYLLATPDPDRDTALRAVWEVSLAALGCVTVLLVGLAGVAVSTGRSRLGLAAREAVSGRLVGCLLTAAVSLPLVSAEVSLANGLAAALVRPGLSVAGTPLWQALSRASTGDGSAGLAMLVLAAVAVALLVVLVVLALARWAAVWLLVALAPVAMGFALLPTGDPLGRVWWRLQLAAVFLPVADAVGLASYAAMTAAAGSGFTAVLAGVAVLGLLTRLPSWAAGVAVGVEGQQVHLLARSGGLALRRALPPPLLRWRRTWAAWW